jgi:hypothetical protein
MEREHENEKVIGGTQKGEKAWHERANRKMSDQERERSATIELNK